MANIFENKKVLVLATTDNMITQFLIPHMNHLQELGAKVECACSKTGKWFDQIEKEGFICHDIKFARNPLRLVNIKGYNNLKKLQKEKGFDIIYCQQPVGGLMGRLLGRKFKKPVIYTSHGFHFYKGCSLKNKLLYKNAEKWLAKYTDVLITINDEDYEAAKKLKAKKVCKISGIGYDTSKFKDLDFDREVFKESLGVKKDEKIVLSVSEMIKRKNYETMIKVISNLRYENFKYLICGVGVLQESLKEKVKKLGLEDKVKFLGYRKDIAKIMAVSDVFLHCSFHEGLTMSIMEAMNCSLPVVCSNVRGNKDLIDNEKGGLLYDPCDVKGITEGVKKLLDDGVLRSQFGVYNKLSVKKYSIENVKKELENIYNGIR